MRRTRNFTAALLLAGRTSFAAEPGPVNFQDHVLPIFRNACLSCHNPDKKKAGLDLSSYEAAMKGSETGAVLQPGDLGKSPLYLLITHAEEPVMPAKSDKLPDSELALIKRWIEAGAPAKFGSPVVLKKPDPAPAIAVVEEKLSGPAPIPRDLLLEPVVHTKAPGAVTSMASSRWAPVLAVGSQKQVLLYDAEKLELSGVLAFPEGFPAVLKFSRNGSLLLAGGGIGAKSGRVVAWDVVTGERAFEAGDEFDAVLAADLSADQSRVVLGGPSKLLKIHRTDGTLLKSIKKHTDWVTAIAFSPDGKLFASGDRQGNLYVWEADGSELFNLAGHKGAITALSASGDVLASASEDGTIKLWDFKEGKQTKSWTAHKDGALSVEVTRDGRIVSCGRDKIARVWDPNGKQTFASEPFGDVALQAALSGDRVVAGDWTGLIRSWRADGKKAGELIPNPPPIVQHLLAAERTVSEAIRRNDEAQARLVTWRQVADRAAAELRVAMARAGALDGEVQAAEQNAVDLRKEREAAGETLARGGAEDIESKVEAAEQALAEARRAAASASAEIPAKTAAAKAAEKALGEAQAKARETARQTTLGKARLAKWRAADLNIAVHAARRKLKEVERDAQAKWQAAEAAAAELTQAKGDLAAAEKSLADAPERVRAREGEIVKAEMEVKAAAGRIEAARKVVEERGTLHAAAREFAARLQAAAADPSLAEAAAKANEAAESMARSVTEAKQAVDRYVEATRRSEEALAAARGALARTREEVDAAPERIRGLRAKVALVEERTAVSRSAADATATAAKDSASRAKAELDQLTARYRALLEESESPPAVVLNR